MCHGVAGTQFSLSQDYLREVRDTVGGPCCELDLSDALSVVWVKCTTSAECLKSIRIVASSIMDTVLSKSHNIGFLESEVQTQNTKIVKSERWKVKVWYKQPGHRGCQDLWLSQWKGYEKDGRKTAGK